MLKKMYAFVLIVSLGLCAAALAEAQQKQETGFSEWLKGLQRKIDQMVPKKAVPLSTGVAGVRGAKEDSPSKLYWKGKKGPEAVAAGELAEFREGIDLAAKGDMARAAHELEEFLKQYPDSPLVPDVKKTLDMVKAEAAAPKPAP